EIAAGYRQPAGRAAGGQKKLVVADTVSGDVTQHMLLRVEFGEPGVEHDFDSMLRIKRVRMQEYLLDLHSAGPQLLGQWRPIIRRVPLAADEEDRAGAITLANSFHGIGAR